jgi:hypothetical protein
MRALLVNPWVYDFKAFDFWNKPVGLLIVANILKKIGFEPKLIFMDGVSTTTKLLRNLKYLKSYRDAINDMAYQENVL